MIPSLNYIGQLLLKPKCVVGLFVVFWMCLVIGPLLVLFAYSFFETEYYQTVYRLSLETWTGVFGSGLWTIVSRSIGIAALVTAIELLVAFPFTFWLVKKCQSRTTKAVVLTLVTVPFFLSMTSRTIVWVPILGLNGSINSLLLSFGLVQEPVSWLLFSKFAVVLGMVAPGFPTMVLPIFLSLLWIDDELLDASADLGASPAQTLVYIVMPLAAPGMLGGVILTLGPSLAAWVVPGLLGGGFVNMLSSAIEGAFASSDYPLMAALSILSVLVVVLFFAVSIALASRVTDLSKLFSHE